MGSEGKHILHRPGVGRKHGFWHSLGEVFAEEFVIPIQQVLGPKLLLPMGCVKLGKKNCVHLPFVGEKTAN